MQVLIRSTFRCSGVFIIDALGEAELQTGKRLYDGLLHLKDAHGLPFAHYRKATSLGGFYEILDEVSRMCVDGFRPILHFEAHGTKEGGLSIASQERVGWKELGRILEPINASTRNNLGVVLAACYGFYGMDAVDILEPCPYNFLIAPVAEIESGYFEDRMPRLYRELFESRSLSLAVRHIDSRFVQFHAESFFFRVFATYLRHSCVGKAARDRQERLLTRAVQQGVALNRATRRNLRIHFRATVRQPEVAFYRMASRFLHRQRSIRYEDVRAFALDSNA